MGNFDREITILKTYNDRVQTILGYSFVQHVRKKGVHLKLKLGTDGKIGDENNFATKEALDATILKLRFFMQDGEDISNRNMTNLYSTLAISQNIKDEFNEIRNKLNSKLDKNCEPKLGSEYFTNRMILNAYIYGEASHETQKAVYEKYLTIFWVAYT